MPHSNPTPYTYPLGCQIGLAEGLKFSNAAVLRTVTTNDPKRNLKLGSRRVRAGQCMTDSTIQIQFQDSQVKTNGGKKIFCTQLTHSRRPERAHVRGLSQRQYQAYRRRPDRSP